MKKTKITLPKKLKVGGMKYNIIYLNKHTEDENVGFHCGRTSTIMVSKKAFGEKRPNSQILETLLHEAFHAIDFVYCKESFSEDSISNLSYAWFDFLTHNDLLLDSKKMPKKIICRGFKYNIIHPSSNISDFDGEAYFSVANHPILKVFIGGFNKGESIDYIKSRLICCFNNVIMERESSFSCDEKEKIIDSAFLAGLYQVFVDNRLDLLIRKYCKV